MAGSRRARVGEWARGVARVGFHIALITLSAGIALSLPRITRALAGNLLAYWTLVENEKAVLVSIEVVVAIGLILLATHARRAWQDRRHAALAARAGIVACLDPGRARTRRKAGRLKERHGLARHVMVMGSTGFRTFVEPMGDLHRVLTGCRSARVVLLNPYGTGAQARARSLLTAEVTPERFEVQVRASIEFLKRLRAGQRDVRLKLYDEAPLFKLAILGDHAWVKQYHPGLGADALPEYLVEDGRDPGGFYGMFVQYFESCWNDPAVPELDLETDRLVYRDAAGSEVRRVPFAPPREPERDAEPSAAPELHAGQSFGGAGASSF